MDPLSVDIVNALPAEVWTTPWAYGCISSSPGRIQTAARDARWSTRYVVATHSSGALLGLMPMYRARTEQSFYREYDVHKIGGQLGRDLPADCRRWVMLGGRNDLAAGIAVHRKLSQQEAAHVRSSVARHGLLEARANGLTAVALYLRDDDAAAFRVILGPNRVVELGWAAILPAGQDCEAYLTGLTRSHRAVVRREWRRIDANGLRAVVEPAKPLITEAAPLVTNIKHRYGIVDPPAMVAMRLRQWADSGAGVCIAFAIRDRDGHLTAVVFGCDDGLDVECYELGLVQETPARILMYLEVAFYAPLRYAWQRGLANVDLGLGSLEAKRLRGAVQKQLWLAVDDPRMVGAPSQDYV